MTDGQRRTRVYLADVAGSRAGLQGDPSDAPQPPFRIVTNERSNKLVSTNDTNSSPAGDAQPPETWTEQRIRALGLVTDVATAARIFGLSRAAAYHLAKRDQFPVSVLRFGSRYRVPVAAILQALHLPRGGDEPPSAIPPIVPPTDPPATT
jgi:hypothetical protein